LKFGANDFDLLANHTAHLLIKSTGSTASFLKTHCLYTAIRFKMIDPQWHLQKASRIGGNGIFVRVAGVVPILTIFFILHALVVDRQ
jgi:hypothetical protein